MAVFKIHEMKILLTICWALISNIVLGQFAIIYDKDGSCNIRSSAEKGNNIIDTLENGHLVYWLETKGNWENIDYTKNKNECNGYVYKSKLKNISDYKAIPILLKEKTKVTLGKDSIRIVVTQQKFNKEKYKLSFSKENKDQLEYVNGEKYWGTDGEIPKSEYKSIEIYIGTKKVVLPKKAIANLFDFTEMNLDKTQVNYDEKNDIFYIQSMNSDGAGAYEVIWKIEKGIYKDRFVAYGF